MTGAVDALKLMRGNQSKDGELEGIHLVQATSVEPNPIRFKLIGTELNISGGMFDIPVSMYPICMGDIFMAYPLIGSAHQRWAVIQKVSGTGKVGTMTGSNSCKIDGSDVVYSGSQILAPSGARAGDRVTVTPFGTTDNVRYALSPITYRLYTECGYYGGNH